jgi:hypothetical protein
MRALSPTTPRGGARPTSPVPAAPVPHRPPLVLHRTAQPRPVTAEERADAEFRRATLRLLDGRPRPGESWDDLARGKKRPWAYWLRRLFEAKRAGARREAFRAEGHELWDRLVDILYSGDEPRKAA